MPSRDDMSKKSLLWVEELAILTVFNTHERRFSREPDRVIMK